MIGGSLLKWLNATASNAGHVVTFLGSFGLGNGAITAYLRTSNAFLSALLCENMGWAYVKDYQKGKMTTECKSKEFISFIIFRELIKGFENSIDLEAPAETLEKSITKQLGVSFAQNA